MIRSMTAYARFQIRSEHGDITWELRSLNSRYLEIHMKLSEEWRSLEPEIREQISQVLQRGKVECNFRFQQNAAQAPELQLNQSLCDSLVETATRVLNRSEKVAQLGVIDILRWPGVVIEPEQDISAVTPEIHACLQGALQELLSTREREGEKIKIMISDRCEQMTGLVEKVRLRIPQIRLDLEQRLKSKLAEIDITVDPNRFEQELVFHLQRLDVGEEIDRLQAHIDEVREVLDRQDPIGRRLDFLMQELNREANTLGSKVASMDIKGVSVELKVLIEQMREQIQNVE